MTEPLPTEPPPPPPPPPRPKYLQWAGAALALLLIWGGWWWTGGSRDGSGLAVLALGGDPLPYGYRLKYEVSGEPDDDGRETTIAHWETYPLCHHVGTPEAEIWVRSVRNKTREEHQPSARLHADRLRERHGRCLTGAYYSLGYEPSIPAGDLDLLRKAWPLVFSALGAGVGMDDYVAKLEAAAKALGPYRLVAMRPGIQRVFYQPSVSEDVPKHAQVRLLPEG